MIRFLIILLFPFSVSAQLVAHVAQRAGSGEKLCFYTQHAGKNPNGRKNAWVDFEHGQGEVQSSSTAGDTTTSGGLPKLKNAGTGPTSYLATHMMPHYAISGTSDTVYFNWIAGQVPKGHTLWEPWMDSLLQVYMLAQPDGDPSRIYAMGLSLGGGGTIVRLADSVLCSRIAFAAPCCLGFWPSSLNGSTYAMNCRNWPPTHFFHAANDPTAAVTLSVNMINTLNQTVTYSPLRGPLRAITFTEFSGATAGTSGHVIWDVVFGFFPTGLIYQTVTGPWVFDHTIYQEALLYTRNKNYRPPGY